MDGFKIVFLGSTWESGFSFNNDPAIEIKRNLTDKAIYEKPSFDFVAYGDLYEAIKDYQATSTTCEYIPITIYKNSSSVWLGYVVLSNIKTTLSDGDKGCYKEVEVIDRNYNAWIKSFEDVEINPSNIWDLECQKTETPLLYSIEFFDPTDPMTTFVRRGYMVGEVLAHQLKLISRNNITFESDFFTTGDGKYIGLFSGLMLSDEFVNINIEVSYKDLLDEITKRYNLWVHYKVVDGVNIAKIEPYDYFYDKTNLYTFEYASNIKYSTNSQKLYSTVEVGEDAEDDSDFDSVFTPFELCTFEKKKVAVSNDCSSDNNLSLVGSFIVDTDKIHYALLNGTDDTKYEDDLFFVETDGSAAIEYTQDSGSYYNEGFLDCNIIRRYFSGTNPISVYPENFTDVDYFDAESSYDPFGSSGNRVDDIVPAGSPTNRAASVYAEFDQVNYDPNLVLSTETINNTATNGAELSKNYTIFTVQSAGTFVFDVMFVAELEHGVTFSDPILMYMEFRHEDSSNTLIDFYYSLSQDFGSSNGLITKNITLTTPPILGSVGDRFFCRLRTESFTAVSGTLNYNIQKGSTFTNIQSCSNIVPEYETGDYKNLIHELNFSDYPICKEDFELFRESPLKSFKVHNGKMISDSFVESITFNLVNGKTIVKGVSDTKFRDI